MTGTLRLRSRVELWKGSGQWEEVHLARPFHAPATALLLCDMWDDHWCRRAARRCDVLARRMDPVVAAARAKGIQIIHAPSDCMEFYCNTPQRQRMMALAPVEPPTIRQIDEPPLPIDDSDGGFDDCPSPAMFRAWTRQHPAIRIDEPDAISDSGSEIYSLLRMREITTLLIAGVHTNFCVLKRSFGIRQMTHWGMQCVLVRDLTDALYNPGLRPFVSHDTGTELVIHHIEQYLCPTIVSDDLVGPRTAINLDDGQETE